MTNHDPGRHLFWLASRGMGVVALVLVSLSVGLGLAMAARLLKGPGMAARVRHAHEALSLSGLIAIAAHGVLLLGDPYLQPGLAGIAVPFVTSHKPFWTGLGVVAGWLAAILGLSFYVRRYIGTRLWRRLHRWTAAVWVLALAHTLGSGTDAGATWLILVLVVTALPAVVAGTYRLMPPAPASVRASS
jgi:sulfoxide reductase heme-binding subunit YedZ